MDNIQTEEELLIDNTMLRNSCDVYKEKLDKLQKLNIELLTKLKSQETEADKKLNMAKIMVKESTRMLLQKKDGR